MFRVTMAVMGLVVLLASQAHAVVEWHDSYYQIMDGDVYDIIGVGPHPADATVVDMHGGVVLRMFVHDSSMLNMYGGEITQHAGVYRGGGVNVHDGYIGSMWTAGTANFYEGHIPVLDVTYWGTANLYGGHIDSLGVAYGGTANLIGGSVGAISFADGGTINLHAYNVTYSFVSPERGFGLMTGRWLADDTVFAVRLYDIGSPAFPRINIVPEPMTVVLLAVGGILLRRRA